MKVYLIVDEFHNVIAVETDPESAKVWLVNENSLVEIGE